MRQFSLIWLILVLLQAKLVLFVLQKILQMDLKEGINDEVWFD